MMTELGGRVQCPEADGVRVICPSAEELGQDVKVNVMCHVPGCGKVVPQTSALRIHLIKTHRIIQNEVDRAIFYKQTPPRSPPRDEVPIHYHCPSPGCVYGPGTARFFTSLKNIKQHYMKMHADKKYKCTLCGSGYGLNRDRLRHQRMCGVTLYCVTCAGQYGSYEALMSHCRRTQHQYVGRPGKEDRNQGLHISSNITASRTSASGSSTSVTPGMVVVKTESGTTTDTSESSLLKPMDSKKKPPVYILPRPTAIIMPIEVQVGANHGMTLAANANSAILITNSLQQQKPSYLGPRPLKPLAPKPPQTANVIKPHVERTDLNILAKRKRKGKAKNEENVARQNMETQTESQSSGLLGLLNPNVDVNMSISIGTQTAADEDQRVVAQTQTAGDCILRTAMQSADILMPKASVPPEERPKSNTFKGHKEMSYPSQKSLKKKRKIKELVSASKIHDSLLGRNDVNMGSVDFDFDQSDFCMQTNLASPSLPVIMEDGDSHLDMSHNETQTIDLWDDLERSLAESISTQTLESFLATNQNLSSDSVAEDSLATARQSTQTQSVVCKAAHVSSVATSAMVSYSYDDKTQVTDTSRDIQHENATRDIDANSSSSEIGIGTAFDIGSSMSCSQVEAGTSDSRLKSSDREIGAETMDIGIGTGFNSIGLGMCNIGTLTDISANANDAIGTETIDIGIGTDATSIGTSIGINTCNLGLDTGMVTSEDVGIDTSDIGIATSLSDIGIDTSDIGIGTNDMTFSTRTSSIGINTTDNDLGLPLNTDNIGMGIESLPSQPHYDNLNIKMSGGGQSTLNFDFAPGPSEYYSQAKKCSGRQSMSVPNSSGIAENVETQTVYSCDDLPNLLTAASQTSGFESGYMNIETQTMDDMFDQLLSNMETQTSDDIFGNVSISHIDTLDSNNSAMVSFDSANVETQTIATEVSSLTDMETQTLSPSLTTILQSNMYTQTICDDLDLFMHNWE